MFEPPLDLKGSRILIANDDGIRARGLKVLEQIARKFSKDVWIFAPEVEQSGAGHSLSLHRPVRARRISGKRYAIEGSPTDCIMLAITEFMEDRPPDLVLSGINRGANLGQEITYSGTVAAALEATLLGIPAISLSLKVRPDEPERWQTASQHAPRIIRKLLRQRWPRDVFMNVNFPNVMPNAITGTTVVGQGRREAGYRLHKIPDPRERGYYVIGTPKQGKYLGRGDSDYRATDRGEITITPLHCDMTHQGALKVLRKALK